VHDRLCRLAIDYQGEPAERDIVLLRAQAVPGFAESAADRRRCRRHPGRPGLIRTSGRAAASAAPSTTVLIAAELAALRGIASSQDSRYPETVFDAMIVRAVRADPPGRGRETTAEQVLREIFEDRFFSRTRDPPNPV